MSGATTFDEVWAREFEPRVREARRRANDQRTEAFLDAVLTLGGEPVRQMTPHDMLHLDAFENPFIAGAPDGEVHFVDCAGFIWELHPRNNHTDSLFNLRRRAAVVKRLAALPLRPLIDDILAYVDRMMMEPPTTASRPPAAPEAAGDTAVRIQEPKTHFIANLMVDVASHIGHIDPMSGLLLAHAPLPRLIQYRRAAEENKGSDKVYGEIDSLRNRCIERLNQINAEARAAAALASVTSVPVV